MLDHKKGHDYFSPLNFIKCFIQMRQFFQKKEVSVFMYKQTFLEVGFCLLVPGTISILLRFTYMPTLLGPSPGGL